MKIARIIGYAPDRDLPEELGLSQQSHTRRTACLVEFDAREGVMAAARAWARAPWRSHTRGLSQRSFNTWFLAMTRWTAA